MNEPLFNTDGECIGSVQCPDECRPGNEEHYYMVKFGTSEYWNCIDPTCSIMAIHPHSLGVPSVGKLYGKGELVKIRAENKRIQDEQDEKERPAKTKSAMDWYYYSNHRYDNLRSPCAESLATSIA